MIGIGRRMIAAEVLKLLCRRSLMGWTAVLSAGMVIVYYGYFAARHIADPVQFGPAGGATSLYHLLDNGSLVISLVAILIGATAGTADESSGVFRDLVTTGRSRVGLFLARFPGALAILVPLVVVVIGLAAGGAWAFAGNLAGPSLGLVAQYTGWLLAGSVVDLALALGLSTLTQSRSITIGVLFAYEAVASPVLRGLTALGGFRTALSSAAVARLEPVNGAGYAVPMSLVAALLIAGAWVVVALAVGAWRTQTRDA